MIPFAHVGFGTQARWLKKGCEIVLGFFFGQVWDSFFDFLAGTICLVFATVWTLNLSFCRVFATFGRSPSILHEISCMWACSPSICMVPHFGMFTFHFAWDLLHVGVFPFHFAWDWLHLGMFTFHFAWGFLHVGVFTFYGMAGLAAFWHVHLPFCMGFATCGRVHLPFCMGFATCGRVHLPFCMGFATCWHVHHITMPTPRDLIHSGMATFTTSSCQEKVSSQKCKLRTMVMVRIHTIMFTTSSCQPQLMYLRAWVLI